MKRGKIKTVTTLVTTGFLNLYDYYYENKLGEEKHWIVASRKTEETLKKQCLEQEEDGVDAIVVVAFHEVTKELVLVRQYRAPLDDYIHELPAGLIDQGEVPLDAVRRELKEETGLEVVQIDDTKGRAKTYLSPGMSDESVSLVYCSCKGDLSTEYLEADEDITPILVSKEMARELLASDEKIDIKAYMVLLEYVNS